MDADLVGRVQNTRLPHGKALLPVLEAVSNSMHAIEDRGNGARGRIDLHIVRAGVLPGMAEDERRRAPIEEFRVIDDGVGFTDANYKSFTTSDSTFKAQRGGKGIGRFIWLKAFNQATVASVFQGPTGNTLRRFRFRKVPEGIVDHSLEPAPDKACGSEVQLSGFDPLYADRCPHSAEAIARRLIEHFLIRFASRSVPNMFVHDESVGECIHLNAIFDEKVLPHITEMSFSVGTEQFSMQFIHLHESAETEHWVHLCANEREVSSENLKKTIPELNKKLHDDDGSTFVVSCYVTGEFLDRNVSQERTDFYFDREDDFYAGNSISRADFDAAIEARVREHLAAYITEIKREKRSELERLIRTEMPEYNILLKPEYAHALDRIPNGASKQDVDAELHRAFRDEEVRLKQRANAIKAASVTTDEEYKELSQEFARFIEDENEIGKANLAKYIVHRHRVLTVLDRFLKHDTQQKYRLESAIHKIIFPRGMTSDDELVAEDKNLWILDERLSFHWFLASDKQIASMPVLNSTSRLEPDVVVFNGPMLFVDTRAPFQSVVVIEFKRPGRDQYKESDNPIQQLFDYVEKIRGGSQVDKDGRPINLPANVPFYVYVVCDLTQDIHRFSKSAGLTISPDALGYFGFNQNYGCYVEVISFSKMLEDSKKRNRVMFERLNLPSL